MFIIGLTSLFAGSPGLAGTACSLNGVPFSGLNGAQTTALKNVGAKCETGEASIKVSIEPCQSSAGYVTIPASFENNTEYNFQEFWMAGAANDANGYTINDFLYIVESLRPGTNKPMKAVFSGAECSEIATIKLWMDGVTELANSEAKYRDDPEFAAKVDQWVQVEWHDPAITASSDTLSVSPAASN